MKHQTTRKRARRHRLLKAMLLLALIVVAPLGTMAQNGADASNDVTEKDSLWFLVTNNFTAFPMSQVGMLVAIDESKKFSVLDINGDILADDVLEVKFIQGEDAVTGIAYMEEKDSNILKDFVNNHLTLFGAKGMVELHTISGMKVKSIHSTGEETTVDVSDLQAGVYVVKCGKQSFKFHKK